MSKQNETPGFVLLYVYSARFLQHNHAIRIASVTTTTYTNIRKLPEPRRVARQGFFGFGLSTHQQAKTCKSLSQHLQNDSFAKTRHWR